MRCLLVADLHYSLPKFDWLLKSASGFDLVVLAGDALDIGSSVDYRAQTIVVRKYLQRVSKVTRLLVCSGNHDLDSQSDRGEKIARWLDDMRPLDIAGDGDSVIVEDTLFTICPWWEGPIVRQRLETQLQADAARRDGLRWVWIHHAPPINSPTSWTGSRSFGDADVAAWIARYSPDIVFSGHVHQSPFVDGGSWIDRIGQTWIFNAGYEHGARPSHVLIDTDVGEAAWLSATGIQIVRLDQPLSRPVAFASTLPDWLSVGMAPSSSGPG
jgi:Icc-related predicted phosphoesterase